MAPTTSTTVHKKRHTKPCLYFQTMQCPFSADECDFAHVYDAQAAAGPDALRSKYRTKPCRYYLQGSCSQGMWCRFKHPIGDWPRDSERSDTESQDEDAMLDTLPDVRDVDSKWKRQRELHPKYKTRPCRDWLMGKCKRGVNCSYLHPPLPASGALPTMPSVPSALAAQFGFSVPQYMYYQAAPGYEAYTEEHAAEDSSSSMSGSPPSDRSSFADDGPPTPVDPHAFPPEPVARPRKLSRAATHAHAHAPYPAHAQMQSPVQVVHVPVPVVPISSLPAAYANYFTQSAMSAFARPRSSSQPPAMKRGKSPSRRNKPGKYSHGPEDEHHAIPPVPALPAGVRTGEKSLPPPAQNLPPKPQNPLEEQHTRGYYPITWRVIGGGVMMASNKDAPAVSTAQRRAGRETSVDEETPKSKPEGLPSVFISPVSSRSSSFDASSSDASESPLTTPTTSATTSPTRPKRHTAKNLSISIPAPGTLLTVDGGRQEFAGAARAKSTPSSPTFEYVDIHKLFSAELP